MSCFRLRDEELVCALITKLQGYLEGNGSRSEICRVYLRHIEHLYYKVCIIYKIQSCNLLNHPICRFKGYSIISILLFLTASLMSKRNTGSD